MLVHHPRRWPNIEPTHGQCPVFAGLPLYGRKGDQQYMLAFQVISSYCCFPLYGADDRVVQASYYFPDDMAALVSMVVYYFTKVD